MYKCLVMAAKSLAQQRSESIGKIISELIRRGLQASAPIRKKSGFPVFRISANAKPISSEDVKKIEDEE